MRRFVLIAGCVLLLWIVPGVRLAPAHLPGLRSPVRDGGFERAAGMRFKHWEPVGTGGVVDPDVRHSGRQSLRCGKAAGAVCGLCQDVELRQARAVPILVTASGRAQDVGGVQDAGFAVTVKVTYEDGSAAWAEPLLFSTGTHGWEEHERLIVPEKAVRRLRVQCLFSHHRGTAWFDDVRVQQLDYRQRITALHPRLFLPAVPLTELRRRAHDPAYAPIWKAIEAKTAAYTAGAPTADLSDPPVWYALAYRVTGAARYRAEALRWVRAYASERDWWATRADWQVASLLLSMATAYDWLYTELPGDLRARVRAHLVASGNRMFEQLREPWAREEYLWNHSLRDLAGLVPVALALIDDPDVPQAERWLAYGVAFLRETARGLNGDGSWHEGVGYWSITLGAYLQMAALLDPLTGERFSDVAFVRRTGLYRLYATAPGERFTAEFGDCPRGVGPWESPAALLRRVAALAHDGHAQWLAARVDALFAAQGQVGPHWLDLFWDDPSVPRVPPAELSPFHHFADLGLVTMRGTWDADAAYVAIKSGPAMGVAATQRYGAAMPNGLQHVHPDEGSLILNAFGQPLLVDDGYVNAKQSRSHSGVLVDGRNQAGSGARWFDGPGYFANGGHARILTASHSRGLDYVACEQAPVYPRDLGLTHWERHVAFVRPSLVFVVDRLAARAPHGYELLWQTEAPHIDATGRRFRYAIHGVGMEIVDLSPSEYARAVRFVPEARDPGRSHARWPARRVLSIRPTQPATEALFITALAPLRSPADDAPAFQAGVSGSVVTIVWHRGGGQHRLSVDMGARSARLGYDP